MLLLNSQGAGTKWAHERSCPGVGTESGSSCRPGSSCARCYAAASIQKGQISKFKMALKEQLGKGDTWDPTTRSGNLCARPLVDSDLKFTRTSQLLVTHAM